MSERKTQPSEKLHLNWNATIPAGYRCVATDESTCTMVIVRQVENNGQDIKEPCPV